METIQDKHEMRCVFQGQKIQTFADKFSKLKFRFIIVTWCLGIIFIVTYFFHFFSALYEVTEAQNSFYTIEVKTNKAYYTRVNEKPLAWIPLSKISKRLQQAIVASEDGNFYLHPGYDLKQLRDALNDSFVLKRKMRGASTITQQLVKNLYLNHAKTFERKIKEFLMSIMIEHYANKDKILEMYLNVIEYGPGIYGIDAASKYYFQKMPIQLNARESAFLAMLLPSPKKYSKSFKNKMLTSFAKNRVESILLTMKTSGDIGELEYASQLETHFFWEKMSDSKTNEKQENDLPESDDDFESEDAIK